MGCNCQSRYCPECMVGYTPPDTSAETITRLEAALRSSQAKVAIGIEALQDVLRAHRSEIACNGQVYTDAEAIALAIARLEKP